MSSEYVTWMLPFMVLEYGYLYAFVLLVGAIYGYFKIGSNKAFMRDLVIIAIVVLSCTFGLRTIHSVMGLVGFGFGTALSLSSHSAEFSKSHDMAPFGHMTAISIISLLLCISGVLTSEL